MTDTTRKTGLLDGVERVIRALLGAGLVLLAWGYDWTGVVGIGSLVLATIALATAAAGYSPADRVLSRLG